MERRQRSTAAPTEERLRWSRVLRAIREARGVTQEGLAAQLGYGPRTVRRWESGEGVPDASAEQALLAYCREHALFRHLKLGTGDTLDLTPEVLRDLLAEARSGARTASTNLSWDRPAPAADSDAHPNLPATLSSFIGREREVAELSELVTVTRQVTLTGVGGVGKTRLAVAVGSVVCHQFADGVWFVDLAPLRDATLVIAAVAEACGVPESAGRPPRESLARFLRDKRLLLILDNFEHLVDAAPTLAQILAAAPDVHALVTSRAALRISGEQEYPVLPLPAPDLSRHEPAAALARYPAVRLFIERARAVRPDRVVSGEESMPVVAALCNRLEGLPLAIELAAARTKLFPPAALLARLDRRLPLLAGGPRDLPQRHQTLRDTIAWSYDLLTADEQRLFRRLAVFVGGCSLEAAQVVCGDAPADDGGAGSEQSAAPGIDIVEGLASLVDKSLLYQEDGPDAESRFAMLDTIREFAMEELDRSGEAQAMRARHARCFLQMVESSGPALLGAAHHAFRLAAEKGNIGAALRWLVISG